MKFNSPDLNTGHSWEGLRQKVWFS
jgi:hypothetical protein